MPAYIGTCHCEALGFRFDSDTPPELWSLRACQCSFCIRHGAIYTSDPSGKLRFVHKDTTQVQRYLFGHRTADFLLCRTCGVFVAAVLSGSHGRFAAINARVLIDLHLPLSAAVHLDYSGEIAHSRMQRRLANWTRVETPN